MFERPDGGERALLVHVEFKTVGDASDRMELVELVASTGAEIIGIVDAKRQTPDPRLFIGSGKVDEIRSQVESLKGEVIIFNHPLNPTQERNLEAAIQCRVLDRTTLILDIFAQRARSYEGKLQVELAQLKHLSTRLVRGWTHLERQKGGIGLRGPGEKQLETDRRLLGERIKTLRQRLEKVRTQRDQGRQARRKAEVPTVALVGYTNAGKSTLFNRLSGANVYAEDQLFATLDPTLRKVKLMGGYSVVLADTVGFIRQLPHDLVAAFRATLQETEEADLLLHVIDAGDPLREENIFQVNKVLHEINAEDQPQLLIYNKIDTTELSSHFIPKCDDQPDRVWLSAKTGEGIDLLFDALSQYFQGDAVHGYIDLPMSCGRLRAELFEHDVVVKESVADDLWQIEVNMPQALCQRLEHRYHEFQLKESPKNPS